MTFELSHTEVSTFNRSWLPWVSLIPRKPPFTLLVGNLPDECNKEDIVHFFYLQKSETLKIVLYSSNVFPSLPSHCIHCPSCNLRSSDHFSSSHFVITLKETILHASMSEYVRWKRAWPMCSEFQIYTLRLQVALNPSSQRCPPCGRPLTTADCMRWHASKILEMTCIQFVVVNFLLNTM